MLTTITRINHNGENKEMLINTDHLISVIELTQEPTYLYDSEGNVVETREPNEKLYKVLMLGGVHAKISETEYNNLVAKIVK